ncbi:uncharacterized protein LOC124344546 [Daphnia pulicaria]|uniref:uncharacterized protein LOC124344546 n=1 Tax=Daphnia pulicaria TaxID=35523 RepID=UPI001EEC31BF|nr:uncharacterized protein LOC124344546 [Daphnia pulicaria]
MYRTFLCYVLLFIIASVKAKLPSLQRVCEKNKNVSPLNLDYDEVTATVNVSLIKNSDELFTSYKIYLFADWNHSTDKISCTDDAYLISHTAYDITAENYFLVSLRYVYSGFYRLTIVPWFNNTISFQPISVYFVTRTTRRPMAVQNWTTQFIIHPLPTYSSIIVQFLPADVEYDFNLYEVLLSECDSASLSISVGRSSVCYANQSKPECIFDNLTVGKYCAFVRPLDQRCNYGNIWKVKDHCTVHSDVIELAHSSPSTNTQWLPRGSVLGDSVGNHSTTILSAVIISLVLVAGFVGALIYRIRRRSQMRNHRKFPAIHLTRSSVITTGSTRKNILLLWLRDNSQLTQQVNQLKDQFKGLNARIMDIYDDELYDELSVDPAHWLNEIMAMKNLRIVVVGSPRLEQQFTNDVRPGNELDNLEGLVLYAIKQLWLLKAASHSLYSTTFFVRFSNIPYDGNTNELTPFRCFLLPMHCEELVFYINS